MNVLLAISDRPTCEQVKRALKGNQLVVVEPGDAQAVLAAALRGGFDLLLVDAPTEPNGGATLCRRLREAHEVPE